MNIWEIDKLTLFITFVIPGFISLKAYELFFPAEKVDSGKQIIDAITYSCINYSLFFWAIAEIEQNRIKETASFLYYIFYFLIIFVTPILLVIVWKWIRTLEFFQKNAPHPVQKPWDYVLSNRKSYWIRVTFKDGTQVGGKYSDKSFASSAPASEQIYLEETWVLKDNGNFERKKNQSEGIMIISSDIKYIEFMSYRK